VRHLEHNLQVAVAHMLQIVLDPERTWWSAIDHGAGKMSKHAAGMMKARGVKRRIPDIIIMSEFPPPHMHRIIAIELKTNGGKLSPAQQEVIEAWHRLGTVSVFVARSLEEVQEILEHCHVPLRRRLVFFPKQGSPYDGGDNEPAQRPASARHRRARCSRKSKNHLPLVLADAAQKN